MTPEQWDSSPFCCVCGSRTPVRGITYWGIEMFTSSTMEDWLVFRFCGDSCLEVFKVNPLAYENRPSYIV